MPRRRFFALSLAAGAALALSACSSMPNPVTAIGGAASSIFRDPRSQEIQSWEEIIAHTDVVRVSHERLAVEARGNPLEGGGTVDLRLLVRAAAETLRTEHSHFAIVHVRDRNAPIAGGMFGAGIYGSETVWIGDYEGFVASRYERDYGAAPRAWMRPGVEAVILMLDESDRRAARAFEARAVYDNLIIEDGL